MEVIFWATSSGDSPVTEFIDLLPDKHQKKIIKTLDSVERFGKGIIRSCTKVAGTAFYELVVDFDKIFYRIFFVIVKAVCFVLHIFKKKTNKTPMRDIKLGTQRYNMLSGLYPNYF